MPAEAFRQAHEALDLCGRYTLSKWDHTPLYEVSSSGPFDRWPSGEGFSHFYGFMAADADNYRTLLHAKCSAQTSCTG